MRCLRLKNEKNIKKYSRYANDSFLGSKYKVEAPFFHYQIYHQIKIHFRIWSWSWEVHLFFGYFFQKNAKIFNFFFKYIKKKVDNERFDYGIWRRNTMFLWIQIDLCTPFEVGEKIEHLYHFFGHFWDWREKCSKSRFCSI